MPGPRAQASPGGTIPKTIKSNPMINHQQFEGEPKTIPKEATREEGQGQQILMNYMEEKRAEARELLKEEKERKKKARDRENSWALMRLSIEYLRENEEGWRLRKIRECERIREEDKKDRLPVVKEKKRKYGLTRLSKEENSRIKKRTYERIEIASAKANLWKKFRDKVVIDLGEEEAKAWERLRTSVMDLEEEGCWREEGEEASKLSTLRIRMERDARIDRGELSSGESRVGKVRRMLQVMESES
jgi:hypothetical protein